MCPWLKTHIVSLSTADEFNVCQVFPCLDKNIYLFNNLITYLVLIFYKIKKNRRENIVKTKMEEQKKKKKVELNQHQILTRKNI